MVTTVTTATSAAVLSVGATSLTLIVVVLLIALLINKEIFSGLSGSRAKRLSRALNTALIPLTIVFVMALAVRVADVLR